MPSHVTVNGLGLTYKGTIGLSTATIPDVCKTPSPGGPVPIPYPNIATQSSLKGGSTSVKAKGKMIAIKGSQYGSSNGDEAGTAGGVKSSCNMKATDWITYSFDVKMDGKNACRHTDKKFQNNKNTACLAGQVDPLPPGELARFRDTLCRFLEECTAAEDQANHPSPMTRDYCNSPGSPDPDSGKPRTKAMERGTNIDKCVSSKVKAVRLQSRSETASRVHVQTGILARGHYCYPDFFVGRPPNIQQVYDIKTSCPPDRGPPAWRTYGPQNCQHSEWYGATQEQIYAEASGGAPVDMVHKDTC